MKYSSIIISDVHLGRPECQHEKLLQFLKSLETEDGSAYNVDKLYLNGDIIDVTNFSPKPFFALHRTVIKKLLRMVDKGVEVIYIIGNHEAPLRHDIFENGDNEFNGISLKEFDIHTTKKGKKYLIIHGDQFDGIVNTHPLLYKLGDGVYNFINLINRLQNSLRRVFGIKEWSFSHWIKTRAKNAVKFISNFENIIAEYATKYEVDGVMSGHIHVPQDKMIGEIHYLNSGCWVELCSAILEDEEGNLTVKRFD